MFENEAIRFLNDYDCSVKLREMFDTITLAFIIKSIFFIVFRIILTIDIILIITTVL